MEVATNVAPPDGVHHAAGAFEVDSLERDPLLAVFHDDADHVDGGVAASQAFVERGGVEQAAFDRCYPTGDGGVEPAPMHQCRHLMPPGEQFLDDGGSDEPAAAGNEDALEHVSEGLWLKLGKRYRT